MRTPIKSYEFRGETLLPVVDGFDVTYESKSYKLLRDRVEVNIGRGGYEPAYEIVDEFDLHVAEPSLTFVDTSTELLFKQAGDRMDQLGLKGKEG